MVGPNHYLSKKNEAIIVKNDKSPERIINITNFWCNELKVYYYCVIKNNLSHVKASFL